jgi:anti-sigma regulatory factor (Ser/Thr protein kinase)
MNKNYSKIREFILNEVEKHETDLVLSLAGNFGFSRQRAHAYVTREVKNGNLIKTGHTRATRYFLASGKHIKFSVKIKPGLAEDRVWSKYVKPVILRFGRNIQSISAYGFTEIFNNAIDHSEGTIIYTDINIEKNKLVIEIMDNGIGIFKKIKDTLNLDSVRESILHLSKGKFTTDPSRHTGEGIFFTSRMFDNFSILSSDMYYSFQNEDWFLSPEKNEKIGPGTYIRMAISIDSKKTPKKIFDKYANQKIGFGKTIVGVALSADPNDPHISRSQAKRLLMGLEKFKTIILDFKGVGSVGQAFVDEVFRVFKNEHPDITIQYVNANNDVESMIKRGLPK